MKTLNISISDKDYNQFGIKQDNLNFNDFLDLVRKELMRQNLNKSLELTDKHGISNMSMEEISNEVKAVRRNAKGRN